MSPFTLFTLPFIHLTHHLCFIQSFPSLLRYYVNLQMILIKSRICITCCVLNKKKSDIGVWLFLFTFFPPKWSCPVLLVVDDKLWNSPWRKCRIKSEIVSSHIDLSGFFFFFLWGLFLNWAGAEKQISRRFLPKNFGKQHFLAEGMVTPASAWSTRAVKQREKNTQVCCLSLQKICSYQSIPLSDFEDAKEVV